MGVVITVLGAPFIAEFQLYDINESGSIQYSECIGRWHHEKGAIHAFNEWKNGIDSDAIENAKLLILIAEVNLRQPFSYTYAVACERILDMETATGIDSEYLHEAFDHVKTLIADKIGMQVTDLQKRYVDNITTMFDLRNMGKG